MASNTISKVRVGNVDYELNTTIENVTGLQTALNAKAGTSVATTKANGLMSSAMVSKLGGIAEGANKTTVDSSLSSSSTNPVQNKVVNSALSGKLATSLKGAANGLAELDANGKVPTSQLPSYVDDVLEYSAKSSFPTTGETGKIYVDTATNKTYRWSGSAYVEISASLALGTTSSTAYYGDKGKVAYDHSQTTGNPHGTTKSDLGLGNVENKSSATIRGELTKSNVTTALGYTPPTTNTTYGVVSTTANGLAPKRDGSTTKFLRADGTWAVPPDNNTNYYHTPSYTSANGYKIATGTGVADLYAPAASGSVAGLTVVHPAASCTTFSSDNGTVTPLAVQKGAKMFSITRPQKKDTAETTTDNAIVRWDGTNGDVQDSTIIIEDVTNTRDKSKAQVIAVPASGGKKMVYGYCTDQVDGTSFIGGIFDASATEYPYNAGLAIGGSSGNLLWKGAKVATTSDLPTLSSLGGVPTSRKINGKALTSDISLTAADVGALPSSTTIPKVNNATLTIQKNGTKVATFTANSSSNATANITVPTGAAADKGVDTSISAASTSTNLPTSKAVAAFVEGKGYKTTDNDTKNTAGSTNSSSKLFLIGATSQAANPQTYSHDTAYVGTDGCLYSNSTKVSVEGHNHGGQNINPSAIELSPGASAGHGGYIDFHYNSSTTDYTSRIWEKTSGVLQAQGSAFQVPDAIPTSAYSRNILARTASMAAGDSMTSGRICLIIE